MHTLVCHPLVVRGELFGSLNLGLRDVVSLTSEQTDIASELADQLAASRERIRSAGTASYNRTPSESSTFPSYVRGSSYWFCVGGQARLRCDYSKLLHCSQVNSNFFIRVLRNYKFYLYRQDR